MDDFRKRWFFVDTKVKNQLLEMLVAPPKKWACWASEAYVGPNLKELYQCLLGLRKASVTGQMVARDFTRRRIAPLQWHSEPMWEYAGPMDRMRLCEDDFTPEVLNTVMGTLFTSAAIPAPANNEAQPLFNYTEETALELRRGLPVFDEWGLVPAGHRGPRGNPWAAELEEMGESSESDEVEESGEAEAS